MITDLYQKLRRQYFLLFAFLTLVEASSLSMVDEHAIGLMLYSQNPPSNQAEYISEQFLLYEMKNICEKANVTLDHPLKIKVLMAPEVNAFATAGSYIFVYQGIINQYNKVDDLIAILCHELTHTKNHHIRRCFEHNSNSNNQKMLILATLPLAIILPGVGELFYGLSVDHTILKDQAFSQQLEHEADAEALVLMNAGGFDPSRLAVAFKKIEELEGGHNDYPSYFNYYSMHPLTAERIIRTREQSAQYAGNIYEHADTQQDFELMQALLNPNKNHHPDLKNLDKKSLEYVQRLRIKYPQSLILKMAEISLLIQNEKWDELYNSLNSEDNPSIKSLPFYQEAHASLDSEVMQTSQFIRKYQKILFSNDASPNTLKLLAHAYMKSQQEDFYYLTQAKYFLALGQPQQALAQLSHPHIQKDNELRASLEAHARLLLQTIKRLDL